MKKMDLFSNIKKKKKSNKKSVGGFSIESVLKSLYYDER